MSLWKNSAFLLPSDIWGANESRENPTPSPYYNLLNGNTNNWN